MNKGRIKRVLCTVLISTILLGFTACGKGKPAVNAAGGWGEDNAALAKEFVYTERELELPEDLGNASVRQVTQSEETIYAVWEIYGNEETPESKIRLMSMKEDGSGIQFKNMQISSASETLDEHTYVGFTNFAFSGDKLFGIKEHYALADAELAGGADATKVMLCCWNFEGDLIWEKNLESEGIDGSKADVWKLLSNANGGVSVVFGGSNVEIVVVTMEGELKERIALSTIDRTLSGLNDLFVGKDGTLLYTYVR